MRSSWHDSLGAGLRIAGRFPPTQNTGKEEHEAVQRHAPKLSPRTRASNVGLLDGGSIREPLLRSERLPQNTFIQTTIQSNKNYDAKMHVDGNSHGSSRINASIVFNITWRKHAGTTSEIRKTSAKHMYTNDNTI